ncbi:MAG TPA: transposase [Thermoanaerobaculia bacterium]|nr:transposase [Thermoanaerobaculia bacterium]
MNEETTGRARPYNPDTKHRRSIRLKGYDYSQAGAYFVTLCAQDRACLFGEIIEIESRRSEAGQMIEAVWNEMTDHYPGVETDAFVVMPNHIHGIIVLAGPVPDGESVGQPPAGLTLAEVVHRFKTMTTKRYTDGVKQAGWPPYRGRLWQRNYFEHVIRDEKTLEVIRQYIADNPGRWSRDAENPAALVPERERTWLET